MEDNIKKFEGFLDRMQGLLDNAKKQGHIIVRVEDLENAFPELAESEDERIRKTMSLEKQGEQKHHEYTLEQAAGIFLDALSNTPYNNKPITDAQFITKELLKFLEDASSYNPNAINEQTPADKVKPKFKVGETFNEVV